MVEILLNFTRANRDGDWNLHLQAFTAMLPYFTTYDHVNYAWWGTLYISEMNQLPEEVKKEFEAGNFVVKRSQSKFNQVDPDQSQEWLNGAGKAAGGIIRYIKSPSALNRWALSFNLRSQIAGATRAVFGANVDEKGIHNEDNKARKRLDKIDKEKLLANLRRFKVFFCGCA